MCCKCLNPTRKNCRHKSGCYSAGLCSLYIFIEKYSCLCYVNCERMVIMLIENVIRLQLHSPTKLFQSYKNHEFQCLSHVWSSYDVSHLYYFSLWAFREDQDLVVQRIQTLPHWLGLLLGHTDAILQEVNFDVGRWNNNRNKSET